MGIFDSLLPILLGLIAIQLGIPSVVRVYPGRRGWLVIHDTRKPVATFRLSGRTRALLVVLGVSLISWGVRIIYQWVRLP